MHKILDFNIYTPERASESDHRINIVKNEFDHTPIAIDLTLEDVYVNWLGPGKFLYMVDTISKNKAEDLEYLRDENVPAKVNNYAIGEAHTIPPVPEKTPQIGGRHLGPLKEVHLTLANPVEFTKGALDRAYQFIEMGSPVEFRIRLLGSVAKEKLKKVPPNPDACAWMHAHFPHLRPDFILKGMPDMTMYLVKPVSDGRTIQFVLGKKVRQMPQVDLTERVFKVKSTLAVAKQQKQEEESQTALERVHYKLDKNGDALEKKKKVKGKKATNGGQDPDGEERPAQSDEEKQDTHSALTRLPQVKSKMFAERKAYDARSGDSRRGQWGQKNENARTKSIDSPKKKSVGKIDGLAEGAAYIRRVKH